jgi:hypothetical protein
LYSTVQVPDTSLASEEMGDDLNIFPNGRRPQNVCKWKTTSLFWQMQDYLNILENGRQPQYLGNLKTKSVFWKMENGLNILANRR